VRPLSITLEGFSAYRRRQTVDLETAEFFSLSGPTGSGKSSLIDGMIFALYGRVPRLGARAVAPVISAGSDRARVSLHFEVRGERYVVSRIAERTDSGATVREARLESGEGTPMASGAGEVTREVEELLRLRFEDFTKTVVLPQGDFARFLNAGSRERRDLLRDLLGLDVYARVRDLANERKAEASGRAASARSQLESFQVPEPSNLDASRERMAGLETLSKEIGARLEELGDAENAVEKTQNELESLDEARRRLGEIHPPPHLDELDDRLLSAREAESLATEALDATRAEVARIEAEIDTLPSDETIANVRAAHGELARVDQRISGLDLESARASVEAAEEAMAASEARLGGAESAAAAARVTHAAHTVGETLVVGRPCPVCAREVESIPDFETPPGLDELDRDVAKAREAVVVAREGLQTARAGATEAGARSSELTELRSTLVERLAGAPSLEELSSAEASLHDLRRCLKETRAELERLEGALKRARRDHEEAAEALATVGKALREAHVLVARLSGVELDPPSSGSDDPIVEWKEFLTWRDAALDDLDDDRRLLVAGLERERDRASSLRDGLVARLGSMGLPAEKPYDVTVARELEVARNHLARLEEATERAVTLNKQLGAATRIEARAGALANHLRANGFERWLMAGAIAGLVGGANELLAQLSEGGFSLEADEEGSFRIVDHRNADELREVATLSGGETFLVSLALSLALAETLSAAGGGGLDAIILDEGFGTLDEESLDVVAAVLEELAGRGLMVGVITHVKELAARAPVRYQVTREPEGSTVEMME
jgi:DNA repair protein SbcC/Rad50